MPLGMQYYYTEGFFYLAIVLEWLFRPQQVALCYAFVGSFFHIRGSIRPQYSNVDRQP